MYFATLTEVPIVQGLLGSGMGHGPALALLLAGPSLSLPSMLVIGGELGIGITNRIFQFALERRIDDPLTDLCARFR